MAGRVTPAQARVLAAIQTLSAKGYPPTVRELQAELGYGSTSTVHAHLENLRAAGRVSWILGCRRTLRATVGEHVCP